MSNNQVTCVIQDKKGFLWIGTYDGLNRFDGYDFKNYFSNPDDPRSLTVALINKLCIDHVDNLWVYGTKCTIFKYDRAGDCFTRYDPALKKLLGGENLVMTTDRNGTLWVFGKKGLARYHQQTNTFYPYFLQSDTSLLRFSELSSFSADDNGEFWIGTNRFQDISGFIRLRIAMDQHGKGILKIVSWYPISLPARFDAIISDNNNFTPTYSVYNSPDRKTWVTSCFGLFLLNDKTNTFGICDHGVLPGQFPGSPLLTWVTEGNQFNILSPDSKTAAVLATGNDLLVENFHATDDHILCFSGIRKSSSEGIGLILARETSNFFNHIILNDHDKRSAVFSVLKGTDQRVYIGTRDFPGLLVAKGNQVTDRIPLITETQRQRIGAPKSLLPEEVHTLWVGYSKNLLLKVDLQSKKVEPVNTSDGFRQNLGKINNFGNLIHGAGNTLWAGGNDGYFRFDPCRMTMNDSFQLPDQQIVHDMLVANPDSIWLASYGRMIHVSGNKTVSVTEILNNNFTILSITPGDRDVLWLALFGGGLCRFDTKSLSYKVYSREQGLVNNSVYEILCDKSGNLWISTNRGISKFDPVTEQFWNFGSSEGLRIEEFNGNAAFLAADGEMLFGGMGGVARWYPDSLFKQVYSGKGSLLIHDLKVSGVSQHSDSAIYQKHLLELTRGSHNVTFYFTCTDLRDAARIRYRYRLIGFDEQWTLTDNRSRFANYVNLKPGEYTFCVEASDIHSKWSRSASIRIILPPLFHQTILFRVGLSGLIVVILLSLIRFYILQVKLAEQKKQELVKLESLRSQLNPHFIFNALNPLNYLISSRDVLGANQYLADFSRLLRLFLTNARSEFIPLSQELETIEKYLRIEQARFNGKFDFEILVSREVEEAEPLVAPSMVQPFLENSVIHGFYKRTADHKGNLTIRFKMSDSTYILCIVEDDGEGIASAEQRKADERKVHVSQGIQIIRERVALYNRQHRSKHHIVTSELFPGLPEPGTRIEIPIPIHTSNNKQKPA